MKPRAKRRSRSLRVALFTETFLPAEDVGGLVMAVRWLVQDRAFARRLGIAARAHARGRGWDVVLDGLLTSYRAVLSRATLERAA